MAYVVPFSIHLQQLKVLDNLLHLRTILLGCADLHVLDQTLNDLQSGLAFQSFPHHLTQNFLYSRIYFLSNA